MFDEVMRGAVVGGGQVTILILLLALLPGLALGYLVLRIREGKSTPDDPHIGIKSGLHYFISASIIILLVGLHIIFHDLIVEEGRRKDVDRMQKEFGGQAPAREESPAVRLGLALIVTGVVFGLIHGLLLLATNEGRYGGPRRVFTATRLVICGLIVVLAVSSMFLKLFQKDAKFDWVKSELATLIVWGPAWLIHLILLLVGTPRAPRERPRFED